MIQEQQSGFVAGTLVHTDKGLVPIQDIKIDDMVLSSPELGTGAVRLYRRVVNAHQTASAEVWQLGINFSKTVDGEAVLVREFIYLTKNHPVYLVDSAYDESRSGRWVPACKLNPDDTILLTTQEGDQDSTFYVTCVKAIERIDERHGFCEEQSDFLDFHSFVKISENGCFETLGYWQGEPLFNEFIKGNYRVFDYRPEDKDLESRFLNRKPPCPNLEAPVFNIEVDDFHIYFVGDLGIWVHDASLKNS
jgi:hypothetical protein